MCVYFSMVFQILWYLIKQILYNKIKFVLKDKCTSVNFLKSKQTDRQRWNRWVQQVSIIKVLNDLSDAENKGNQSCYSSWTPNLSKSTGSYFAISVLPYEFKMFSIWSNLVQQRWNTKERRGYLFLCLFKIMW